jgi:hypothetical protein
MLESGQHAFGLKTKQCCFPLKQEATDHYQKSHNSRKQTNKNYILSANTGSSDLLANNKHEGMSTTEYSIK